MLKDFLPYIIEANYVQIFSIINSGGSNFNNLVRLANRDYKSRLAE